VVRVVVGVAHHVHRRARGVGGALGDDVGHLLETAAVDGEKPEARSQRAVLDDGAVGEQLGKRLRAFAVRGTRAVRPVRRIPPPEEFDPALRQPVMLGAVDDALEIAGPRRARFDPVVDVHPRVGRPVVGVHRHPVAAVAHRDALGTVERGQVVVGEPPQHTVHL
jgi:hypothetical protein